MGDKRSGRCVGRCGLLVALAALSFGCPGVQPEEKSGPDREKEAAALIALNKDVVDEVNFASGDRTDWKYFEVKEKGIVTVEVTWGNTSVYCGFVMFNKDMVQLARYEEIGTVPKKRFRFEADPGTYYLRFRCEDEGDYSSYMLRINYKAKAEAAMLPIGPESEPKGPGETPLIEPPPPPPPEDAVVGTITKMTVKGGKTTLRIDKGAGASVKVGDVGEIMGVPGGTFKVTKVLASYCLATTSVLPGEIGASNVVKIRLGSK